MPSSLTWLDHDGAARERSLRILALFREKDSRDELGLGGIRDSFADALFPGTSTIMTRLRYMFFVPWIYSHLENKQVSSRDIGDRARQLELALVSPLLANEDSGGVFGRNAKGDLQRLPSSVYWAGLRAWGILQCDRSQADYHRMVDVLYARRERQQTWEAGDGTPDPGVLTWYPRLLPPPPEFPDRLDLQLTAEEAKFLLDRIVLTHPDSLLAWLAKNRATSDASYPWGHPDAERFPGQCHRLLEQGRAFSDVMHGAALLYNLSLAEHAERQDLVQQHREALRIWAVGLDQGALFKWELGELWQQVLGRGHTISKRTMVFVEAWVMRVRDTQGQVADDPTARDLVVNRERALKGAKSRFVNRTTLAQWSGHSGLRRFSYRWPTVQTFLDDLNTGLGEK